MNRKLLIWMPVALMILLTGCDMSKYEPVTVAVYPSTHKCSIKEQPIDCEQVGNYLRDTLKVEPDHQIDVSYTGADQPNKNDVMVDQVANTVRASGFTKVNAARFDIH
jgi:predicted Zn-dependent protease